VVSAAYQQRISRAPIFTDVKEMQGKNLGFFSNFPTRKEEVVTLKVGISFVDLQGAENNYRQEAAGLSFDEARRTAFDAWNKALGCIRIEGGSDEEKTVFYTALYHTMIDPRIFTDVDGRYVGGDGKIYIADSTFTKRTIFSGWDVFRSQFPLQTIIHPRLVSDELNSLITLADQSGRGYYERWEFLNAYSGCMLGNPALSVLADAYLKGIRTYDVEKAYRYAVNTSRLFGNEPLGYTPSETCVSHTLEYAYDDWCIGQLAYALGKNDEATRFRQKGEAYRNIFDKEKGWFRPRRADGSWFPWPKEGRLKEGYGCVESNLYQQGWFVPHDIPGMVSLMGGREKVLADLTHFFEMTPSSMLWNRYYNHANEPVHFVPFLFNELGAPRLTQKWTRYICSHAYHNSVEGIVGNEDVGQMSAWYILAASGIHPICPGDNRFEITSPVFDKITFQLDSTYYKGNTFTVVTHNNTPGHIYIQRMLLNGKPYRKSYIDFEEIAAGSTLELFMGD
jgi:predicted alpha-1,2-mannosidase